MFVFLNGKFVKSARAKIFAFDAGFLYGDGIYETLRTRNGCVEDLDEHLDRMRVSAKIIIGRLPWSSEQISKWTRELVRKNGFKESRIRITVSAGTATFGDRSQFPTILITAEELKEEPPIVYKKGVKVVTYQIERPCPEIKTTNLAPQLLAREYMKKKKAYEVLLIDRGGNVREGSITNVFMVSRGGLVTPRERILHGIVRAKVIDRARACGIKVSEREIFLKELKKADEIFVTNSIKGIVPVIAIDGRKIGDGRVGPITKKLSLGRPIIMGILNVTPDSFSDGGQFFDIEKAVARAQEMIREGASIIDIGGEGTGPGSKGVTEEEELRRVIPVIKRIREQNSDIRISIDTYKSRVARLAIRAGADMINDVTALRGDPKMARTIAKLGVPVILMFSKDATPRTTMREVHYDDIVATGIKFLQERISYAVSQGIKRENIIIDPGMGAFVSSDPRYSWEILERLTEYGALGLPILIGASRKSFLAGSRKLPPHKRLEGSLKAAKTAIQNGADILRVHDVKETRDFILSLVD